jgi:DNA-binding CsgD family transcriptional regulator
MAALSRGDLRAALDFIEFAWGRAEREPFPLETVKALQRLIPCDIAGYCELDNVSRTEIAYVGTDGDGDPDGVFWDIVDEHPICRHQQAYRDFSAIRTSDVMTMRRLVRTRAYAEWFRPYGITAELECGIADSRVRTRTFILDRCGGDFSGRDVAVLELLRPHLARIRESSDLRRAVGTPEPAELERLTAREAEILELVALGLSNAAVAERLWISPGTVKKHLDNVYAKLGVANRTAAVARIRGSAAAVG